MLSIKIDSEANELIGNPSLALPQSYKYIDLLCKVYGHKPYFAKQYNNNKVTNILPFVVVSMPILGKKIVSLPYDGSYGDCIKLSDTDASVELYEAIMKFAKDNCIKHIDIRTRDSNHRILKGLNFNDNIDLVISEICLDYIKENNKYIKKRKSDMRLARNHGLHIDISSDFKDMVTFYIIMSKNMRRYGTPMYPFSYFKHLWNDLGKGELLLIKGMSGRKMISGILLFQGKEISIIKYSAALPEYMKMRPYASMNWKAIDICMENGCKALNMGTSLFNGTGLIKAKEGFGAKTVPLVSYTYDFNKKIPSLSKYRGKYSFLIKLWKYQPLFTSQLIGSLFWRWYC